MYSIARTLWKDLFVKEMTTSGRLEGSSKSRLMTVFFWLANITTSGARKDIDSIDSSLSLSLYYNNFYLFQNLSGHTEDSKIKIRFMFSIQDGRL